MNTPQIQQSKDELKEIISHSAICVFLWKNEENWPVEFVSRNVSTLLGYTVDDFMTKTIVYSNLIHPDDIERVTDEVAQNVTKNSDSFVHKSYRIKTKKGKWIWVFDQTLTRKNDLGEITHFEGTIQDITTFHERNLELKKDTQESKEREHRYKVFANSGFEALFVSENGYCIEQNKAAQEMFGYTDKEAFGMFATDIFEEKCRKKVVENIKNKYPKPYDVTGLRKDGTTFFAEIHGRTIKFGDRVQRVTAIRDLTERKTAELKIVSQKAKLDASNKKLLVKSNFLQAVNRFARKIENINSIEDIVWDIVENVIEEFKFEDCEIFLLDDSKKKLVQTANYRLHGKKNRKIENPLILAFGEGIIGASAQSKQAVVVPDTSKDERYLVWDRNCLSELTVPMMADGEIIGVIDSEHPDLDFFSKEHVVNLTTIANIAASRIKSAFAEEEVKESELKHRLIFEHAHDAIFIMKNGDFLDCNHVAVKMFGCQVKEELIGKSAIIFSPKYQYDNKRTSLEACQYYESKAITESQMFEWLHQRKNGETFDAEVRLSSFWLNNELMYQAVVRDITNKKRDQRRLVEQQEKLNQINKDLESKSNFLEIVNEFSLGLQEYRAVDEVVQSLTQVLINKFYFEDCVVYLLDEATSKLEQVGANGVNYNSSKHLGHSLNIGEGIVGAAAECKCTINVSDTSKDKRYIVENIQRFSELAVPIIINGNVIGIVDSEHPEKNFYTKDHEDVVTTLANISASRLKAIYSENAVQESELKHRLIYENAKDSIILIKDGLFLECNQVTLQMFGCETKDQILGKSPGVYSPTYQHNGKKSDIEAKRVIQLATDGIPQTFEWIHLKHDKTPFDAEVSLNSFNFKGEQFVQAVVRDISERKRLYSSIEKSEALYRNLIESTGTTAWELDVASEKFTYMGAHVLDITGYPTEYWVDLDSCIRCIHPMEREEARETYLNKSAKGENFTMEYRLINLDGSISWIRNMVIVIMEGEKPKTLQGYFIDITKEKQLESVKEDFTLRLKEKVDELFESRENYKRLFDDSLVAMMEQDFTIPFQVVNKIKSKGVTDIESYLESHPNTLRNCYKNITTLQVNKAFVNLVGVESADYLINNLNHFFTGDTHLSLKGVIIDIFNNKKISVGKTAFTDVNGKKIYGLAKLSFREDVETNSLLCIVSIINNTERVRAEKELFEQNEKLIEVGNNLSNKNYLLDTSRKRFEDLFERNPVSLWEENIHEVIDLIETKKKEVNDITKYIDETPSFLKECISVSKIVNVNQASLPLFGVESKQELMQHLDYAFNENSFEVYKQEIHAIANGAKQFTSETEFVKKNGEIIHAIVNLEIIDDFGNAIISIVDVTALKNAELKLLKAKEKAEESDKLKSEFLNNISHEIRTPLNGIIGFSSFLSDSGLTPELQNQYVSIIQNSGNQLIRIIDEILEISKLDSQKEKPKIKEVCLNSMLFELTSIFNLVAEEKGIALNMKYGLPTQESYVLTDETKLNKIISNILQNAFKFTSSGEVNVKYEIDDSFIQFKISDTGIGINNDKLGRIFERFAQEDKSIASNYGGLGLGLSIVKEHVDILGGHLSVESEKGKGTRFIICIPYNPVGVKPKIKTIEIINPKNTNNMSSTVLMVEDDAVNAMLMERFLENSNLFEEVIHAVNGQEAIDFCKENADIDVVLMDIGIPIKNGFEATKEIKEFRPNLPIIAQTAYTTMEDRKRITDAGCNGFISKPIDYEKLIPLLKSFLNK